MKENTQYAIRYTQYRQIMDYFRDNIEKVKGYEPGFQPKEADVIKLNTNENPYPPSPAVMKV